MKQNKLMLNKTNQNKAKQAKIRNKITKHGRMFRFDSK